MVSVMATACDEYQEGSKSVYIVHHEAVDRDEGRLLMVVMVAGSVSLVNEAEKADQTRPL